MGVIKGRLYFRGNVKDNWKGLWGMTVPTNTYTTYTALGQAEDFNNTISIVVQEQVPFQASVDSGTAYAKYHQWQTDAIATVGNQAVIEGDTIAAQVTVPTTVLANYCQINLQAITVSNTEEQVRKYGRGSEVAYQMMKIGVLLKLRLERTMIGTNLGYSAGNLTTGRQAAGVLAYIKTNVSKAGNGSNPAGTGADARTDGTPRALTQALFDSVMQQCAQSGATPNLVLASPFNMTQIQKFDNYTTKMQSVNGTLDGVFDAINTPFGLVQVRFDNQMRSAASPTPDLVSELMILDTNFWAIKYLRPISVQEYAKTGDTVDPKYMVQEFTLEALNEKSSGLVADLTP